MSREEGKGEYRKKWPSNEGATNVKRKKNIKMKKEKKEENANAGVLLLLNYSLSVFLSLKVNYVSERKRKGNSVNDKDKR